MFNEGYYASSGEALTRPDLSGEAIRLGRLLVDLPPETEAVGLLALMLLHESRRTTRTTPEGELVTLEEQDRAQWNQAQIAEGANLMIQALVSDGLGAYTLQAAIVAIHATAPDFASTNWMRIVELYDLLLQVAPSPVVEVNRATAVAMRDGPAAGLALIDEILARGDLTNYHFAYAAQADLYRRLGQVAAARAAYERAMSLTQQEPERRFFERQMASLANKEA